MKYREFEELKHGDVVRYRNVDAKVLRINKHNGFILVEHGYTREWIEFYQATKKDETKTEID